VGESTRGVVALEDEDAHAAAPGEESGGSQAADARPDHDRVERTVDRVLLPGSADAVRQAVVLRRRSLFKPAGRERLFRRPGAWESRKGMRRRTDHESDPSGSPVIPA
jgi:hypothetical protein